MLQPAVWQSVQERQRVLIQLLNAHLTVPISDATVLEIGCGSGSNLLDLIRFGFRPENVVGNELLAERYMAARNNLPSSVRVIEGDASKLEFADGSFDLVYQSTVFSSLLDDEFQTALALQMWRWVKPGGAVLWYDFTYNNPSNADVRGVKVKRIRVLFPEAAIDMRRVTLAPPISRLITRIHPKAYIVLNVLPFLRTHLLCWIGKRA
jgi:SAM-dependent methyltransferase